MKKHLDRNQSANEGDVTPILSDVQNGSGKQTSGRSRNGSAKQTSGRSRNGSAKQTSGRSRNGSAKQTSGRSRNGSAKQTSGRARQAQAQSEELALHNVEHPRKKDPPLSWRRVIDRALQRSADSAQATWRQVAFVVGSCVGLLMLILGLGYAAHWMIGVSPWVLGGASALCVVSGTVAGAHYARRISSKLSRRPRLQR
jgi:hypothetical protein